MPAVLEFPRSLLREQSGSWRLVMGTASPGLTGSGAFPLVRLDGGGLWRCDLNGVSLLNPARIKLWRATEMACDGGSNPIVVPMCDVRHIPLGALSFSSASIPHSDGTFFSDGSGYYNPVINAETVGDADLRDTELTISFNAGGPLEGGEYFSIQHETEGWRLYMVVSVAIDGSGDSVCTIRPPLREDTDAGTPIDFDRPRCVMRLSTSDAMAMTLELRRHAQPNASFVETFFNT